LILSRKDVIPLLQTVLVAPVTSTIRGSPAEVVVGIEEGLKGRSAVNLDHVQTVDQGLLGEFLGTLSPAKMAEVCAALAVATGWDP
jgi:mRNA interferase MazF